jgi:2-methylcitrate dehydratase
MTSFPPFAYRLLPLFECALNRYSPSRSRKGEFDFSRLSKREIETEGFTMLSPPSAKRPAPDAVLTDIADYVLNYEIASDEAYDTARICLMDSLGCGIMALNYPACTKLLGPVVPGATLAGGARVPGTSYELDPVQAAFNIGGVIRWLDFNDTWLAAEWGHPSDNLGGILACADWLKPAGRRRRDTPDDGAGRAALHDQGPRDPGRARAGEQLQSGRARPRVLVKVATTAVAAACSAWQGPGHRRPVPGLGRRQSLRTYRHAPNTGSRKSWAAGDASARGVRLAMMVQKGEMGLPSA